MPFIKTAEWGRTAFAALGLALATSAVAWDAHRVKDISPSRWYCTDGNVRFFPPGPEFKLTRELAAMKALQAEAEAER